LHRLQKVVQSLGEPGLGLTGSEIVVHARNDRHGRAEAAVRLPGRASQVAAERRKTGIAGTVEQSDLCTPAAKGRDPPGG
jgi:hypothetical protein